MQRPHVLRVITRLGIAGATRHAILLTRELARRGFRSELVWGQEEPGEGRMEPLGFPSLHVSDLRRPVDPRRDLRAYRSLRRTIAERRPQIVHTHLSKAGTLGRLAGRRAGVEVLMHTYHGHVLEGYFSPAASRGFREVERRLARMTDVLIAISSEIRDELLEAGVGRPSQWVVVPLGLELDALLTSEISSAEGRRRLGLAEDGPVVGIVGRLAHVKDHELLLQATARLLPTHPDVTVVIAGDGPLRSELERSAAVQLGKRVRFLGWVKDLEALYAALDVIVLTSKNEGTPVALIEAGAARRPAVATDVGGVRNVVREGETGFVVPAGNAQQISEAVARLLADSQQRADFGRAARDWVRDRFSLHRLVDEMAELYQSRAKRADSQRGTAPR